MNLVFCFGIPKSGTTFLQMILHAHPEVSCPSEHQFDALASELKSVFDRYNQLLREIDARTAQQTPVYFQSADMDELFVKIVEIAARRGAGGKKVKWYGLNDNAILQKVPAYASLFPEAKFICIVRDPREVAVSSWYHNQRYFSKLQTEAKTLGNWSRIVGEIWRRDMGTIAQLQTDTGFEKKLKCCRYEDLILTPLPTLKMIFDFLRVDTSTTCLKQIIKSTRFDRFRGNPFFRAGKIDSWKTELTEEMQQAILSVTKPLMKKFGYGS